MITRNLAIAETAFGLLALLAAWNGYRRGPRWTWMATWALAAVFVAAGVNLLLLGGAVESVALFGPAVLVLVAQLLARRGLAR